MKYKYIVVTKAGFDIAEIDKELAAEHGSSTIPERKVNIANELKSFSRVSEWLLTHEEAEKLKKDSRIKDVGLDFEHREDLSINSQARQDGDFTRIYWRENSISTSPDYYDTNIRNWGIKRSSNINNPYTTNINNNVVTAQGANDNYTYNSAGEGVDLIIFDEDMEADHPEFVDKNGNSRVKKIDWIDTLVNQGYSSDYLDGLDAAEREAFRPQNYYGNCTTSHGTPCASTAAGNLHGWAKDSHIYLAKTVFQSGAGTGSLPSFLVWYDWILHWHKNKGNNRPTILNQSWGITTTGSVVSDINTGVYRGVQWVRDGRTDQQIIEAYDLPNNAALGSKVGGVVTGTIEQHDEMNAAGIHLVNAAGNHAQRTVPEDHPDYNNTYSKITDAGTPIDIFYARNGTPYSSGSITVGAVSHEISGDNKDKLASFSNRGPSVDLYAAGQFFAAAAANVNGSTEYGYPDSADFGSQMFGGTSGATPQVAGVMALHLSHKPNQSPERLKSKILSDALDGKIKEETTSNAFVDSNNKFLYSSFNESQTALHYKTEHSGASLSNNFKVQTEFFAGSIQPLQSSLQRNFTGVYYQQDFNSGTSFVNNSYDSIKNDAIIYEFYQQKISFQNYNYVLTVLGDDLNNSGWEKVILSTAGKKPNFGTSFTLHRKDAKWEEHLGKWTWIKPFGNVYGKLFRNTTYRIGFI